MYSTISTLQHFSNCQLFATSIITLAQETIISYLYNRFLTGLTVSVLHPFNSVVKVIFISPKSDHITLLKNPLRVFYHLSFYCPYGFIPRHSLWSLSSFVLSHSSSTGLISWHLSPSQRNWGLIPLHHYNFHSTREDYVFLLLPQVPFLL